MEAPSGNWRRLKSESLEDFAFFLVRIAVLVAVIVVVFRWALTVDVSSGLPVSVPKLLGFS